MSDNLLVKLRPLQRERSDEPQFESHLQFQKWADQVTPLLYFDKKLQSQFSGYVLSVKYCEDNNLSPIDSANSAIGILNQAVTSLENPQPIPKTTGEPTTSKTKEIIPKILERIWSLLCSDFIAPLLKWLAFFAALLIFWHFVSPHLPPPT